jgi:putative tryptophan/tyrosine transport system substrate-binding protein
MDPVTSLPPLTPDPQTASRRADPMMERRTFLVTLGLSVLAAPLGAEAQQAGKLWRIGYLQTQHRETQSQLIQAFEEGLRERGYTLGRDVVIEYRFAEGRVERLPELAADLVRLKVDVIVTGVNPVIIAAKKATTTIPIVMAGSFNPVEQGLVASLAHPGGNVTGLTLDAGAEILTKRLQLLREINPKLSRVAALSGIGMSYNPSQVGVLEDAGRGLGITILPVAFRGADDVGDAFAEIRRARAGGLIVFGGPLVRDQRASIASLAVKNRLPAIYTDTQFVRDGGLMSYGASAADQWRRAAGYVDRILKGAKPADLPVEQPTKFELVINLKTAKALGLTIPQSLLLRADEVIQ